MSAINKYARKGFANKIERARDRDTACGQLLQQIARACMSDATATESRHLVRAPTGAGEVDPSAGGFLVPTLFESELLPLVYDNSPIAQLCDWRRTDKPIADARIPGVDETSRADSVPGTPGRWGGAQSYWVGEANVPTSFPKWRNLAFSAKKLVVAVVCSNELLADAPLLGGHLLKVASLEFAFRLDHAILLGSGVGHPLGILSSPATVTIAKETGQATKTVVKENLQKMWSAVPASSRRRAIWVCGETVEAALDDGFGDATSTALYMPNASGGPTLKGRPLLTIEQASTIGTVGDIAVFDPSYYVILSNAITPALSVHVRFNTDESIWRFVWRLDAQPAIGAPLTAFAGGGQRSPFVALAAR